MAVDGVSIFYNVGTQTLAIGVQQDNGVDFSDSQVLPVASTVRFGLVQVATNDEAAAVTSDSVVVTPGNLAHVDISDMASGTATDGQVPTADGSGGVAWEDATGGSGGTPQTLSRFEAVTTANTTAQALSATYANIIEIATTDIFANEGTFTVATVSNISTITVPHGGLFKVTAHIKATTGGSARAQLYLRANVLRSGVVVANSATIMGGTYVRAISPAASGVVSGTTTLLLETGDTITFQMAEEGNTGNTYTIGGADSVVEIIEIPSEVRGVEGPAVPLSDATPEDVGTAAAGSSTDASRDDHVHGGGGGGGGADDGVVETISIAADGTVTLTRSVGVDITEDLSTALALLTGATFTGAVHGVTAAENNNSTQFATTAFVGDGFDAASFSPVNRHLTLARLGGGTPAGIPLTFFNAWIGADPPVNETYHGGDTVTVGGIYYAYSENVSATVPTADIPTDNRFIALSGPAPATAHDLWAGFSADTTVTESEVLAGASSDTNSVIVPTGTGSLYLFIWRADADGGDPTEVHIAGGGNQRNVFGTASALTVSGVAGQLIVSVNTFNADLTSGETLRVV